MPTQLATDNFTRADANPISGTWTSSSVQIVGDVAEPSSSSSVVVEYAFSTAAVWSADQYSEISGGALTNSGNYRGPTVRMSAGGTGYGFMYTPGNVVSAFLERFASGG